MAKLNFQHHYSVLFLCLFEIEVFNYTATHFDHLNAFLLNNVLCSLKKSHIPKQNYLLEALLFLILVPTLYSGDSFSHKTLSFFI